MSHRETWRLATAPLRSKKRRQVAKDSNLELDLPLPESGKPEDVSNLPALRMAGPASPMPVTRTLKGQELNDFQTSLTNTEEERDKISNLLAFWERIPRYRCGDIQGITSSTNAKEVGIIEYDFEDSGEHYTLEMTPAQIRVEENGVESTLYCYPDNTEELVELALIKIAMDSGDLLDTTLSSTSDQKAGRMPGYGVHFQINQIRSLLRSWGRGRTYSAVLHALQVLHKCNLSVRSITKGGIKASAPILSELISYEQNGFDRQDRNGYWTARFHPIISLGIHTGLYQQFNLYRTASLRSKVAQAVAKLIILEGRNICTETPYVLDFLRFREITGLLHYSRESQARRKFRTDTMELVDEKMLIRIEWEEIKRGKTLVNLRARMYASAELVKEMKASHKRSALLDKRRQVREYLTSS